MISEFFNCLSEAAVITKLDLRAAYNLVWIKKGDVLISTLAPVHDRFLGAHMYKTDQACKKKK